MDEGTPFTEFAETCRELRKLDGRHAKRDRVADLLASVEPDERASTARFLAGQPLSPLDPRKLGVGPTALEEAKPTRQAGLFGDEVTIREVAGILDEIADVSGSGSSDRRVVLLDGLVGRMDESTRPWLRRLLLDELRTGVQEGLVLEGIARAADVDSERVRRAHQLRGDVGEVAEIALGEDAVSLESVGLELGRPLSPMLAEKAEDLEDALAQLGTDALVEPKLDGARVQIHRDGGDVQVFSRRLTEVTGSLPEAVSLGGELETERAVVVGEAVACGEDGRPLPFQELMRRFRREHDQVAEAARVPVEVHLFDCLHVDGRTLIDAPLRERRRHLASITPEEAVVEAPTVEGLAEAEPLYENARKRGHEGVMVKDPDSVYEPGRRGQSWLKVKPERTLDLVVLGAEWGHGRRSDWLSNYHLGVRVPPDQRSHLLQPDESPSGPVTRREGYAMVGKTFKGLTDAEFERMTELLEERALERPPWGVIPEADVVVEVAFDEVQDSPHYESGYALRFARVTAIREDKPVDQTATLEDVREIRER